MKKKVMVMIGLIGIIVGLLFIANSVFANNTGSENTILQTVEYIDVGAKPVGEGLSAGLGLSAVEQIELGKAMREAGVPLKVHGAAVASWRVLSDEEKVRIAEIFMQYPHNSNMLGWLLLGVCLVVINVIVLVRSEPKVIIGEKA